MSEKMINKLCEAIEKISGCEVYGNADSVYVDCKYNEDEARCAIENLGLVITKETEYCGSSCDGIALYVEEK